MSEIVVLTELEEEILTRVKLRIPYREEIFGNIDNYNLILNDLVLFARQLGLARVYPFYDYSNKALPKKYALWQYRCCLEVYSLADKSGFITYSENGLSWGKLTDGVPLQIVEEITSKAGIPSKIESDDEDEQ